MKNTIKSLFAEMLCPHYCLSCGAIGKILCECCRKNMKAPLSHCLVCGGLLKNNVCASCNLPFSKQFCLGERVGVLKNAINVYKYNSVRACGDVLCDLILDSVDLTVGAILVPLPTISRHKRERGFGHMEHLARLLAKNSSAHYKKILSRAKNTVQVGSDSEKRKSQAKSAYALQGEIDGASRYYLLDDVWTTGSSMLEASKILRSAGAQYVNAILIAKTV